MHLKDWQQSFIETVHSSDHLREKVYAESIMLGKLSSLSKTFPATSRMIGQDAFEALATDYCASLTKTPYDIGLLGKMFSQFIKTHPIINTLPYLSELARLEWHWHLTFNAKEACVDQQDLQLALREFGEKVVFQPAECRWLHQYDYAVDKLWVCCQPEYDGSFDVDTDRHTTNLLLYRQAYRVNIINVSQPVADFYFLVDGKRTLDDICKIFLEDHTESVFQQAFLQVIERGLVQMHRRTS